MPKAARLEIYGNFASIFLGVISRTLTLLKKQRLQRSAPGRDVSPVGSARRDIPPHSFLPPTYCFLKRTHKSSGSSNGRIFFSDSECLREG